MAFSFNIISNATDPVQLKLSDHQTMHWKESIYDRQSPSDSLTKIVDQLKLKRANKFHLRSLDLLEEAAEVVYGYKK